MALLAVLGSFGMPSVPVSAAAAASGLLPAATAYDYSLGTLSGRQAVFQYGGPDVGVPVGVDTTRIVIQPTVTEATGGFAGRVSCYIVGTAPEFQTLYEQWSAVEWSDAANRFFDVPPGFFHPGEYNTSANRIECSSPRVTGRIQVVALNWRVEGIESAGTVVNLTEDPALLTGSRITEQYASDSGKPSLRAGDVVRVTGPAGSWPADFDGSSQNLFDVLLLANGRNQWVREPAVTEDGSTVTFQVPPDRNSFASADNAQLKVYWISTADDSRFFSRSWLGPVDILEPVVSTTTLTISPRFALPRQRVTATATVMTMDPTVKPDGTVSFELDGKPIGRATLVDAEGVTRIDLPSLPRGEHRIVARYTGTDRTVSSDAAAWMRVLG